MLIAARSLAALAMCLPLLAFAGQTWTFNAQVLEVTPDAIGFPGAFSGLKVGDSVTATLSYDTVPAATVPNTFIGTFGQASLYKTSAFTFTLATPGATLTSWSSPALHTFVWNNDVIFGGSPNDGLLFTNVPFSGTPLFQLGNLLLNTSTFSSEAFPQASVPGLMVIEAREAGASSRWFLAQGSTLQFNASVVPEPATAWLWLAGLVGLGAFSRRRN